MEHLPEKLLRALKDADLEVIDIKGKMISLRMDYLIEVERENLYKLKHAGHVIAPFQNVLELCSFIKADMTLNE